jgi:hypothetical protein
MAYPLSHMGVWVAEELIQQSNQSKVGRMPGNHAALPCARLSRRRGGPFTVRRDLRVRAWRGQMVALPESWTRAC